MNRQLLLTTPESDIQWSMRFYNDYTVDVYDSKDNLIATHEWQLKYETVFVNKGCGWWEVDNMIKHEGDRCRFYAELFYAIVEHELLS